MRVTLPRPQPRASGFRHEALLYAGASDFVERTMPLVRTALAAGEPVLVVTLRPNLEALQEALGPDADGARFADMAEVGRNPGRIIPLWREFVDRDVRRGGLGIGEPVHMGRSPAELVECQRHEALLNVAFGGSPGWRLVCPYDTTTLPGALVEEARRSHPALHLSSTVLDSDDYTADRMPTSHLTDPLPEPVGPYEELEVALGRLSRVRQLVRAYGTRAGMVPARLENFVIAVDEIATNSVRYGGGTGRLRLWRENGSLVCEISDRGRIVEPLAGRVKPPEEADGGRGLWMTNQLCDLVQIRAYPHGGVVRLHLALDPG